MSSSLWKEARTNLQDGWLRVTRRNWDGEPKKQETPINVLHRKLEIVPILQWNSESDAWDGPKEWQSKSKKTTLHDEPCMRS